MPSQPPSVCGFPPLHHLFSTLQVQFVRHALRLRLHDPLPRAPKVGHLHPHAPLAQGQEPGFRANGFDVGAGEVVFLVDELVELDVVVEGHFGGVEGEDFTFGVF